MPDKTLPIDTDDYSLPGRSLDSNAFYRPAESAPKPKSRGLLIGIIVFAIFSGGFYAYYFMNQSEIDSQILESTFSTPEERFAQRYNVGEYGSAHEHAAVAVFLDGHQVNFGHPQFQLTSKYIHFEDHNPYLVHKHATGAPLDMLFSSFGMKITQDCIIKEAEGVEVNRFCSDETKTLLFFINGEQVSDIADYEISHNDRVLITLGDSDEIQTQLNYLNSLKIFDIPKKTPNFAEDQYNV